MQPLSQIEGTFVDVDGRYVIVVGRFNHHVVDSLVEGAVDSLTRHGVDVEISISFMCRARGNCPWP